MFSQFCSSDYSNRDFNVVQYGHRVCSPNFAIHYISCPNFLFHYVYSGKGVFRVKDTDGSVREYNLSENQAFIIFPGEEAWYIADSNEPFTYRWIEFFGEKSPSFLEQSLISAECPVYNAAAPYECGHILEKITDSGDLSQARLTALFWMFVDSVIKEQNRPVNNISILFNNALNYIHENADKSTTVTSVANAIGISRGYLSRIFSKFISQTPKQYILNYRINKAKALLIGTDMTVTEISNAMGYESTSDFTKAFKRITGFSPTEYKKNLIGTKYKHTIVS